MKILVLSFYFNPDLCACSFRNGPLVDTLSKMNGPDGEIVVLTTIPNRYSSYKMEAKEYEKIGNVSIYRIKIREHKNGFVDQIFSFISYFRAVLSLVKDMKDINVVYASSSRLFTAFLGSIVSKRNNAPLYLDIRDIFKDAIVDVLNNKLISAILIPILTVVEKITFTQATHINLVSAGFKNYFHKYKNSSFSFFTNGIDDVFLEASKELVKESSKKDRDYYIITYAGNIGDSQGLDNIIPSLANSLGPKYKFNVIGDGGARKKLLEKLHEQRVVNVEIIPPVERNSLIEYYKNTDFLFLHLNTSPAFEKVIPSKLFEYAVFNKPIIAGVSGFCADFINENISNCIVFNPADSSAAAKLIQEYFYKEVDRSQFVKAFSRKNINEKMAASIIRLGQSNRIS